MFIARTSIGTFPAACAASVWKITPRALVIAPISASGWTVPISLFAAMTETRMVSGVIAARSSSRSMKPSRSTPSHVTRQPSLFSRLNESSTDLCSVTTEIRWLPRSRSDCAVPLIARLFDSVAPLVKQISFEPAPMSSATCSRAASTAFCASQPYACCLLAALPKRSVKYGSIASSARGSTGVVAW